MRGSFSIVALCTTAVLLVGACEDPPAQQDSLTRLTVDAGYDVAGIPWYDGQRWLANVRVPDCGVKVVVGAQIAPENESPTTFTVLSIGDAKLDALSPDASSEELNATDLRGTSGIEPQLDCT
jgi:hypothetical protein